MPARPGVTHSVARPRGYPGRTWLLATRAAIELAAARHIEIILVGRGGALLSLITPEFRADARRQALAIRRSQYRALESPRACLAIAREIVRLKLAASGTCDGGEVRLLKARTVQDVITIEAKAAESFYRQFSGARLTFKGPPPPDHWLAFERRMEKKRGGRLGEKGAQFVARDARTPVNAMLNFVFAIALSRVTRAVVARGLDPCAGFLHSADVPGRFSLSYDVLELLRPRLTHSVFDFCSGRAFVRADFVTQRGGEVRCNPGFSGTVARLALETATLKNCVAAVDKVARLIREF